MMTREDINDVSDILHEALDLLHAIDIELDVIELDALSDHRHFDDNGAFSASNEAVTRIRKLIEDSGLAI